MALMRPKHPMNIHAPSTAVLRASRQLQRMGSDPGLVIAQGTTKQQEENERLLEELDNLGSAANIEILTHPNPGEHRFVLGKDFLGDDKVL